MGFPEEVQEVTQGGGQSSKAGRHAAALSNDYLVTNTEIFQNFHNRCCHTDAAFVAFHFFPSPVSWAHLAVHFSRVVVGDVM